MTKPMPKTGEFCWNELLTTDIKKAKEFYSSLFGWEYDEHDVGHGTYTMIKGGDNGAGGMMQIPADKKAQIPPHWMTYIYVENLDESLQKAQDLGASVKMPITPVSDFGRFAVIADPTGAPIALWQSMKSCG